MVIGTLLSGKANISRREAILPSTIPFHLCFDTGIASKCHPCRLYIIYLTCSTNLPSLRTFNWVASLSVTIWVMLPVMVIVLVRASLKSAADVPSISSVHIALVNEHTTTRSHAFLSFAFFRVEEE